VYWKIHGIGKFSMGLLRSNPQDSFIAVEFDTISDP